MIELSSIFCESSNNREFGAWGEVAQATSSQAPLIFSSSKLQRMLQPITHMSACTSEHERAGPATRPRLQQLCAEPRNYRSKHACAALRPATHATCPTCLMHAQ